MSTDNQSIESLDMTIRRKASMFIIATIDAGGNDLFAKVVEQFSITHEQIQAMLDILVAARIISAVPNAIPPRYVMVKTVDEQITVAITPGLEEDKVWREEILPRLADARENVRIICNYGFTEMLNNAIDHSEGRRVLLGIEVTFTTITLTLFDDGVGIFNKIAAALHLEHPRYSILELAKGKVTSDPSRHSGEGIFFTSRVFDYFSILSHELYFSHKTDDGDWLLEKPANEPRSANGTFVTMQISSGSSRALAEVFSQYTSEDDMGFTKTKVPVSLAEIESGTLISRSQAKRVLSRLERFNEILLDFSNVATVGQGFADEIFRVFQRQHPDIKIVALNTTPEIDRMIKWVQADGQRESSGESGPTP